MNAGRDVERLITGWLAEEAEVRAPDRVLDSARRSIDRTPQRRFLAAWREPVNLSPTRLAALAAVLVVALAGAALVGRLTAPGSGSPSTVPTPILTPGPTVSGVTLESFRTARDTICNRAVQQANPLKASFQTGLYDTGLAAAERSRKVAAVRAYVTLADAVIADLDALEVPAALATEEAIHLAHYRDLLEMVRQIPPLIDAGDLAGAQALDNATEPVAVAMEGFEAKHGLAGCP